MFFDISEIKNIQKYNYLKNKVYSTLLIYFEAFFKFYRISLNYRQKRSSMHLVQSALIVIRNNLPNKIGYFFDNMYMKYILIFG